MDLLRKVAQDHPSAVIVVTHDEKISTASTTPTRCATACWEARTAVAA
jgi:ABC-type lipoprotein export system ATPase subunit